MKQLFNQGGKGSTGILTNKQAVARHFGVKQSEVVYFSVGVDLGGYKVIYDKETQRAYSLPTNIAPGTTAISLSANAVLVHSAGSVDLGELAVSREEYVTLPGSFDTGATLNVKNELLTHTGGKYRWDGEFPKTIPSGSTPASTGGVSVGAWLGVGDAVLRNNLISATDGLGDALIKVVQPYPDAVPVTQHQHNVYLLTPFHFGAVGDGVADDTSALNAWANCGAKSLYWPPGKYLVTPTNGVSLDMDNYHTGDSALTACVTVPYGVKIYTAGTETQLCVKDADSASTVGLAVSYPESSYSQGDTDIGKFMIRLENGNGRYGILTPLREEMFTAHRAKFKLGAHFGPQQGRDDLTVLQYSWVNGMLIGDAFSGSVHVTGYGSYNVQQVEGTQFQCVAVKMKSVRGNVGVDIRFNTNNWWKFVELSDGVEGFVVKDSEGLGAFVGIDLTNPASEPGGFIDNVHVNVKQNGVRARNRPSLQIGNIEVYKSDGFATDLVYDAVLLVDCQEVTINSIHAIVGNSITNAQSVVNSTNSTFRLNSYFAQNIRFVDYVVNSPDCYVGVGTVSLVEAIHSLSGSATNDFQGSDVLVRAYRNSIRPLYAVMDTAFNRVRARFPQDTNLQTRKYMENTVSAAGTLTVEPRLDPSQYYIIMNPGSGAFTYSIELDRVAGVPGDIVYIKIAGSSSPNPTVVVKNGIGGGAINTFNNIGAIRLNCAYRMDESGNWRVFYVTQSVETTYV